MKKLTAKQVELIAKVEALTSVKIADRVSVERSKTSYIALDVDGMTENDERNVTRAGHSYGWFRVEPNGYRCVALVLN